MLKHYWQAVAPLFSVGRLLCIEHVNKNIIIRVKKYLYYDIPTLLHVIPHTEREGGEGGTERDREGEWSGRNREREG